MLFNSWDFVFFLLVVFPLYYTIPVFSSGARLQVTLLFVSSLVFYAFDKPWLVLLLLFSILLNGIVSKNIIRLSVFEGKHRTLLFVGVASNLMLIAFFKYAYLIVDLVTPDDSLLQLKQQLANIPLPIGVSFYTFQAITLIVDLHRKGVIGVRRLHDVFNEGKDRDGFAYIGFYIAFFPQLVAGPIVKAHDFIQQIESKTFERINWSIVCNNIITGYFFKMVIADNLKDVTYLLNSASMARLGKLDLIVLLYGYSFQIFADFAGYSLIAIGLGALFGYRFPINFNFPYISSSITEFWRRWHISLSSFLKEYLYIPLGGNRKGKVRTYINLFLVMFLGGLWHGAAWSYAIWGVCHGVLLAIEKFWRDMRPVRPIGGLWLKAFLILITFHIVSFMWLLFLMPDFDNVIKYYDVLFTTQVMLASAQNLFVVGVYSIPVILYHAVAFVRERRQVGESQCRQLNINYQAGILGLMLFFISLNAGTSGAFIYFQF